MRRHRQWPVIIVGAAGAYAGLRWLGRTSGSTPAERALARPGDDLVADPLIVTDHAITIDAPPERVWPWLVQMGWHRGGWYTARWVDQLLFPNNDASAEQIIPELQHLQVGDFIPDGAPETECGFAVEVLDPCRCLVLHSNTHLPPDWHAKYGAWIDWTWTFALHDLGDGRTRFHFRSRANVGPPWLAAGYWLVLAPADFVMAGQMMRGLKTRAERTPEPAEG